MNCRICGYQVNCRVPVMGLSKHIQQKHQLTLADYYLLENPDTGTTCVICGGKTKFKSYDFGFKKTCSNSCACTQHRRELQNDPVRYSKFVSKVSINQSAIWAKRDDFECLKIFMKSSRRRPKIQRGSAEDLKIEADLKRWFADHPDFNPFDTAVSYG